MRNRAAIVRRNRERPFKTYGYVPNQRRYGISIAEIQSRRLNDKNSRRFSNGLPPRATYAEI